MQGKTGLFVLSSSPTQLQLGKLTARCIFSCSSGFLQPMPDPSTTRILFVGLFTHLRVATALQLIKLLTINTILQKGRRLLMLHKKIHRSINFFSFRHKDSPFRSANARCFPLHPGSQKEPEITSSQPHLWFSSRQIPQPERINCRLKQLSSTSHPQSAFSSGVTELCAAFKQLSCS